MGIQPLPWTRLLRGGIFSQGRTGSPCNLLMTQYPGAFGVTYSEVGSPRGSLDLPPPPPPRDCSAIPGHFLDGAVPWVGKAAER